jgi:excisionase family DNA binding protein
MLRVEDSFVEKLLQGGEIPALRFGTAWSIPEDAVDNYLDRELEHQTNDRRAGADEPGQMRIPSPPLSAVSAAIGQRRTQEVEFVLSGSSYKSPNSISVLVTVLVELAKKDNTFLERFSSEGARTRRYISREKRMLYKGRPDLGDEFSKPLVDGWWIGTNYSRKEIEGILKKACAVAGLRFGEDLVIGRPRQIDRERALAFVGIGKDSARDVARRHDEYFAQAIEEHLKRARS